jgi:putative ABC transport system substrate-binding protein
MSEYPADLGMTGLASDLPHDIGECVWVRNPTRCLAFARATVEDKLHVEAAFRSFLKHFDLDLTGKVPSRLPTLCRVKPKDQPRAVARRRAAEPTRVYRLAACTQSEMAALSTAFWIRFFDRLRQLGYVECKTLIVDRYAADGEPERYGDIARNVVRSTLDVIVIGNLSHPLIAQFAKETSTIPIVATMGDPVAVGLVQNIARPERNITGISGDAGMEMQGKHLDILREAVPSASRIAYLSPREEWEGAWGRAIMDAGHRLGLSIIGTPVDQSAKEPQYRQAFDIMAQQSADALMYNGVGPNIIHRTLIPELAD